MAVKGPGGMGGGLDVEEGDTLYAINAATHHASIDVRVEGLSYRVSEQPVAWWERMAALQMPWECRDKAPVLQVLKDVAFTVRSGQMLAIMGNSGNCTHHMHTQRCSGTLAHKGTHRSFNGLTNRQAPNKHTCMYVAHTPEHWHVRTYAQ